MNLQFFGKVKYLESKNSYYFKKHSVFYQYGGDSGGWHDGFCKIFI